MNDILLQALLENFKRTPLLRLQELEVLKRDHLGVQKTIIAFIGGIQ